MMHASTHGPDPTISLRRVSERHVIAGIAVCRRGAMRETVQLRDLSRHGARLVSIAPLRADFPVWLKIAHLQPIETRVVWVKGLEAGCLFAAPLHEAIFDALLDGGLR